MAHRPRHRAPAPLSGRWASLLAAEVGLAAAASGLFLLRRGFEPTNWPVWLLADWLVLSPLQLYRLSLATPSGHQPTSVWKWMGRAWRWQLQRTGYLLAVTAAALAPLLLARAIGRQALASQQTLYVLLTAVSIGLLAAAESLLLIRLWIPAALFTTAVVCYPQLPLWRAWKMAFTVGHKAWGEIGRVWVSTAWRLPLCLLFLPALWILPRTRNERYRRMLALPVWQEAYLAVAPVRRYPV